MRYVSFLLAVVFVSSILFGFDRSNNTFSFFPAIAHADPGNDSGDGSGSGASDATGSSGSGDVGTGSNTGASSAVGTAAGSTPGSDIANNGQCSNGDAGPNVNCGGSTSVTLCNPDGTVAQLQCYLAGENETCTYGPDASAANCTLPPPSSVGWISASPNPCTIPAGGSTCTSSINWGTTDAPDAAVFMHGSNTLFAQGPSGTQDAPWITAAGDTFDLHATNNAGDGQVLSSVTVTGACASGTAWDPTTNTCAVIAALEAPTNVQAQCSADGAHANLYWDPVPGATSYYVNMVQVDQATCTSPTPNWQWASVAGGTCYDPTWPTSAISSANSQQQAVSNFPVTPGTSYTFAVAANNAGGTGPGTSATFTCSSATCPDGTTPPTPGDTSSCTCMQGNQSACTASCTLTPSSSSLSQPGTVTLTGSVSATLLTSWTGSVTDVGSVDSASNPGPWSVTADTSKTYVFTGTATLLGIIPETFYCSTEVTVGAAMCPDGITPLPAGGAQDCPNNLQNFCPDLITPLPAGGASSCTCAQGNTAACTLSCTQPLTETCSADGSSYTTTDSSGNTCGATTKCPYAAAGYTCIQNGSGASCPLPTLPTVTFTAQPPLVHAGDHASATWSIKATNSTDEKIVCTVSGPQGVLGSGTGGAGYTNSVDTGPIYAQTTFTLNCVGEVDNATMAPLTATVSLIPTYTEPPIQ